MKIDDIFKHHHAKRDRFIKPYIIAEVGVNHGGSMDRAREMILLAKQGGANAVKFQSYKADTLASLNSPSYWDTSKESAINQHELFKRYDQFEPNDYSDLANYCEKIGIDFLSTPFDVNSIEYLDPLVDFFKIASADITNIPFLRQVAEKGKPVILSTGASTLGEIDLAIETLMQAKCESIALLHCILNYPTEYKNANLSMIKGLQRSFPGFVIGYSDHTMPDDAMTSLVSAYLLGATVIEKHFTYDKSLEGNDHYHAMDVNDLARFIDLIERIYSSLGESNHKSPISSEAPARLNARRSIVLNKALFAGHKIKEEDMTYKRPGSGISPLHWDKVIGMKAIKDMEVDHILLWSDIEN
jgi:sialic acid synthase SpsE